MEDNQLKFSRKPMSVKESLVNNFLREIMNMHFNLEETSSLSGEKLFELQK